METHSTHIQKFIPAPRARVYAVLLDPDAVVRWRVPDGMTGYVHTFEPWEGGAIRMSLTYDVPTGTGKSSAQTDTYHGLFVRLVPGETIVEVNQFESADPALQEEMTITLTLADVPGGTKLTAIHDNVPAAVAAADNELGWQMALAKLAALVQAAAI
jgi:uncharacterized protein YndB with AHSA1/START domain